MKAVILAGGLGTRLSEETHLRPKPMVEIGGRPILWHILNIYASHEVRDFIVAGGYRCEVIKDYFYRYPVHYSDWEFHLASGSRTPLSSECPDWTVAVIDTGLHTMTGGRLLRLREYLAEQPFMATYGDGVANVDLGALVSFHAGHGRLATVTATRPPARFGELQLEGDQVVRFSEKPNTGEGWINGGFFVFEPGIFDYMEGDETSLERHTLERLAEDGQMMAFRHDGFWHPMDTLRDKRLLESLWESGEAPWRTWS